MEATGIESRAPQASFKVGSAPLLRGSVMGLLLGLQALALTAAPGWAQTAYTTRRAIGQDPQRLYTWDLASGEEEAGAFLRPGTDILALAFSPEGVLYGGDSGEHILVTIDPATGETATIGSFGSELRAADLTFDACGRLWMVALDVDDRHGFYRVEPASGRATPIRPVLSESTRGIAAIGEELVAVTAAVFPQTSTPHSLFELDPANGDLNFLTHLEPSFKMFESPRLDFDADGQLWAFHLGPPPDLPSRGSLIDRAAGTVTTVSDCFVGGTCRAFAIAPPIGVCSSQSPVEIPAVSRVGLAILAVALLLAALSVLRAAHRPPGATVEAP